MDKEKNVLSDEELDEVAGGRKLIGDSTHPVPGQFGTQSAVLPNQAANPALGSLQITGALNPVSADQAAAEAQKAPGDPGFTQKAPGDPGATY